MSGDTFEALLEAYTERGHLLLALERERDEARAEIHHLRRGIEGYRRRVAANTDEDLAAACREYQAWEHEEATRDER